MSDRPAVPLISTPPPSQRRKSVAILEAQKHVGGRLSGLLDSRKAVFDGNMLGEHGMRIRQFAMQNDMVIVIRDLSEYAGSQLASRIQYDSPVSEELMTTRSKSSSISSDSSRSSSPFDTHRLDGAGKDLHLKAKSSIYPEIGGLIPALNILSKKPLETPEARARIDEYFEGTLTDLDSPYTTIIPRTPNGYDICFYQPSSESKDVAFTYRDKDGKHFKDPGDSSTLITDEAIISKIQEVKVFADKETNSPLIPDYDIAILGSKISSIEKITHPKFGIIRPEEESVITDLERITNNMIRHGADTENPLGYKFEMTPETPYTIYTPDGNIRSIDNERSYIGFVNAERRKGYNLVLNPRTGVEMDGDKYVLPEKPFRIDYEEIDKQISSILRPEQKRDAESIRDKEIQYKQMSATLPEAFHAILAKEARERGHPELILDDAKGIIDGKKEVLRASYLVEMETYKATYKTPSPTETAYQKKSQAASRSMIDVFSGREPHIAKRPSTPRHSSSKGRG